MYQFLHPSAHSHKRACLGLAVPCPTGYPGRLCQPNQHQGWDQGRWGICRHLICLAALLLGTLTLVPVDCRLLCCCSFICSRTAPSTLIWCRPLHYFWSDQRRVGKECRSRGSSTHY